MLAESLGNLVTLFPYLYPAPVFVTCLPQRESWQEERGDILPKVPWAPAEKDKGRWEGDVVTWPLSMLMQAGLAGRNELHRKSPHLICVLAILPPPPAPPPQKPLTNVLPCPLPGFALLLSPCSPLHGSAQPQTFKRQTAGGKRRGCQGLGELRNNVITTPGSCLSRTVLVILFPGRGIWGAEKAHGVWHFESGVGRPWDSCLPLPWKMAILKHLRGSTGTSLFWGLSAHPDLREVLYMHYILWKVFPSCFFP